MIFGMEFDLNISFPKFAKIFKFAWSLIAVLTLVIIFLPFTSIDGKEITLLSLSIQYGIWTLILCILSSVFSLIALYKKDFILLMCANLFLVLSYACFKFSMAREPQNITPTASMGLIIFVVLAMLSIFLTGLAIVLALTSLYLKKLGESSGQIVSVARENAEKLGIKYNRYFLYSIIHALSFLFSWFILIEIYTWLKIQLMVNVNFTVCNLAMCRTITRLDIMSLIALIIAILVAKYAVPPILTKLTFFKK